MATIQPTRPAGPAARPDESAVLAPPAPARKRSTTWLVLTGLAIVNAVAVLVLTGVNFLPALERPADAHKDAHFSVPAYDYKPWTAFPVQVDGRTKPFSTFAVETLTHIHGRSTLQGADFPEGTPEAEKKGKPPAADPVAVVLNWMLLRGAGQGTAFTDWETYPFILCEHRGLRAWIYLHRLEDEELKKEAATLTEKLRTVDVRGLSHSEVHDAVADLSAQAAALVTRGPLKLDAHGRAGFDPARASDEARTGKYICPDDLRNSPGLNALLTVADGLRAQDSQKAMQYFTPEQRAASEVSQRLTQFDSVSQNNPPSLMKTRPHDDPVHIVALDRVPGSGLMSMGQMRKILQNPEEWRDLLRERLRAAPQDYINPEKRVALRQFQEQVKAGKGAEALDAVASQLAARDAADVAELKREAGDGVLTDAQLINMPTIRKLIDQHGDALKTAVAPHILKDEKQGLSIESAKLVKAVDGFLGDLRAGRLKEFKERIDAAAKGYDPNDLKFRMLHLDFLELSFPDLYADAARWQAVPTDKCEKVLGAFKVLQDAYTSENAGKFTEATQSFFAACREVSEQTTAEGFAAAHQPESLRAAATAYLTAARGSDPAAAEAALEPLRTEMRKAGYSPAGYEYPFATTIGLELTFNKARPFMWGWVLMLPAVLLFALSYGSVGAAARACYAAGFGFYLASLAFQLFGFYARVAIAGRPPVSNMYETVIFVAFMSGMFALVLEAVYRKTLFALAGAAVSTISLVLADQLPLVLDPKISPLTPVLRSNWWLIVHVMTIVASYAGGTLAWGLGNISLALLAFGNPKADTVKTLAQYTRRALEIAILLLATGTFLGGVWAAYSWGRFWGWDPKETWALIALVVYVIPLHARYVGWVKDYGLAVGAVLCYAAIVMCWYGVNFVLGAGLHSYGFGGGGPWWVLWAGLINVEWVLLASMLYLYRQERQAVQGSAVPEMA